VGDDIAVEVGTDADVVLRGVSVERADSKRCRQSDDLRQLQLLTAFSAASSRVEYPKSKHPGRLPNPFGFVEFLDGTTASYFAPTATRFSVAWSVCLSSVCMPVTFLRHV